MFLLQDLMFLEEVKACCFEYAKEKCQDRVFPFLNEVFFWNLTFSEGEDPGLNEDDMKASVATLQSIAEQLDCDVNELREKEVDSGHTKEYLIRERVPEEDFSEVRLLCWIYYSD